MIIEGQAQGESCIYPNPAFTIDAPLFIPLALIKRLARLAMSTHLASLQEMKL